MNYIKNFYNNLSPWWKQQISSASYTFLLGFSLAFLSWYENNGSDGMITMFADGTVGGVICIFLRAGLKTLMGWVIPNIYSGLKKFKAKIDSGEIN